MTEARKDDTGSGDSVDRVTKVSTFVVAELHDREGHHLRVLRPGRDDWLVKLAEEYRRLRTESDWPANTLALDGVEVLAVDRVRATLAAASVPPYESGNFGVARSDLAELLLGHVGTTEYGTKYCYRGIRDRELVSRPGRGIDQIGVEWENGSDEDPRTRLTLVIGEAKTSSEARTPPRVVDDQGDCLRVQHLEHLSARDKTADKIWHSSRRSSDEDTQAILRIAAEYFRMGDNAPDNFRVVLASILVRPSTATAPGDFGTFYSAVDDYKPAQIRFHIVHVPGDIESVTEEFVRLAETQDEAASDDVA